MEIELRKVAYSADSYDVQLEFARILHSRIDYRNELKEGEEPRLLNFQVELGKSTVSGGRHNGRGFLTVPYRSVGQKLLDLARREIDYPVVNGLRIEMRMSQENPPRGLVETLKKVPYQDPSIVREHETRLCELGESLRVETLQFGIWLPHKKPRVFAVEWQKEYITKSNAQLAVQYDRKSISLILGDPYFEEEAFSVLIKFSNIKNIWAGYEYKPHICFELYTPAIMESERINRTLTGVAHQDSKKYKKRIGFLDENHGRVSPYAFQIRVVLHQLEDINTFYYLCEVAELRTPSSEQIISEAHDFYSKKVLGNMQMKFKWLLKIGVPWTVVFQIEYLLRVGLLTTIDILDKLWKPIVSLAQEHPSETAILLRDYVQALSFNTYKGGEIVAHFNKYVKENINFAINRVKARALHFQESHVACHHVTFTPTRVLLEGPYHTQSNRVLRRYSQYRDNFLRVDFRDEDRLQFRWDREVDGSTFLEERVGGILENGFTLGGRFFEFLAYSSSALREHAVWFVSPFEHEEEGHINAAKIRRDIGNFSGDLVYPARFAARLAQAFTATYPSVRLHKSQWERVPDIGTEPYLHTDGVGTVSLHLAELIWAEQCKEHPKLLKKVMPSAFQIRFLGFKGVVVIDHYLSGEIQMRLRKSMEKFTVDNVEWAGIEIAKAFYSPGQMYLNRPLVMLLEDLGVPKEAFLDLLKEAIANVKLAKNDIKRLLGLLKRHRLGNSFGFSELLYKLYTEYGLHLNPKNPKKCLRTPFINTLVKSSFLSIFRDIQYRCRIPVPKSWQLVGVADEGQAYIEEKRFKRKDVFTLEEGTIYACIQETPESEPIYLKGNCNISRSPVIYPGDVQLVYAIGKPPSNKICAFRNLVNVVVFPCTGERSQVSKLSGGDLDGDIYEITQHEQLRVRKFEDAAEFPPVEKWEIDKECLMSVDPDTDEVEIDQDTGEILLDQEKVIPYVHKFIVEYINSDLLGLLSDKHLVLADQSSEGTRDPGCLKLAELCNQAVDYPKNGKPVECRNLPKRLIPYKPDWKKGENDDDRETDFYKSERALGEIYRYAEGAAEVSELESLARPDPKAEEHPVYFALNPKIQAKLRDTNIPETEPERVFKLFKQFETELRYICATHTLTDHIGTRLKEEEVVVGSIAARCSQQKWRSERIYRMGVHAGDLERQIRKEIAPEWKSMADLQQSLGFAWSSWKIVIDRLAAISSESESVEEAQINSFGLNSFSFVLLNVVLDSLEQIEARQKQTEGSR